MCVLGLLCGGITTLQKNFFWHGIALKKISYINHILEFETKNSPMSKDFFTIENCDTPTPFALKSFEY